MADYERVLCVKNEVFVYKIPPRTTNRGYRAADWKLDLPDWTGRLKIVALKQQLTIKLEDKTSGELFAQCPVEAYPGVAVESVLDSSRYFVLKIADGSGKSAFIGVGFSDRGDSFDLNVAMQDHFKQVSREEEQEKNAGSLDQGPKLDLGFKEGQTIKIKINTRKPDGGAAKTKPSLPLGGGGGGMFNLPPPPPPGGVRIQQPPPSAASNTVLQPQQQQNFPLNSNSNTAKQNTNPSNVDMLLDFGTTDSPSSFSGQSQPNTTASQQPSGGDVWGDFTSSESSAAGGNSTSTSSSDWVGFE